MPSSTSNCAVGSCETLLVVPPAATAPAKYRLQHVVGLPSRPECDRKYMQPEGQPAHSNQPDLTSNVDRFAPLRDGS
jgi:hypothetical protein